MKIGIKLVWITLIGSIYGLLTFAQINIETPESVAERYFNASSKQDWSTFSELTHPESLYSFKKMFSMEMDQYFEELGPYFFNIKSKDEFDKLSDKVVCERFFRNLTKEKDDLDANEDQNVKIFGSVIAPPDVAYVVHKKDMRIGNLSLNNPRILVLKKDGNHWRVPLPPGILGDFAKLLAQNRKKDIRTRGGVLADPEVFATKIPSLPASVNLEIDQSPEIYGFKLGMSMDVIFKRFPLLRKQDSDSGKSFVTLKFVDNANETESNAPNESQYILGRGEFLGYTNVREIKLEYNDRKLTAFKVAFGKSIKWDNLDQYLYNLQQTHYLPGSWRHWSKSDGITEKATLEYKQWILEASLVKGMPEVYIKELAKPLAK
jgi:hypothetical protein